MGPQIKQRVENIVVVGGGSAGWIVAGRLASEYAAAGDAKVNVTLIESPDVQTIGVGEGTWPTMRATLRKIGIKEADFLAECSAAFKQGTRFVGWVTGPADDVYYHPFSAPVGYPGVNTVPHWQPHRDRVSFANAVSVQAYLCDRDLAPKQATTPEFGAVANYAYHLDAGKFAAMLQKHCTGKLGVRHVVDHVTGINGEQDEPIRSVSTAGHGEIEGDLFVDCTGSASLLLGGHYQVPYVRKDHILFNDSALAAQVPYDHADAVIASQTLAVARPAGWIWDIGLTNRRGIGYTYSSRHTTDDEAREVLRDYIGQTSGQAMNSIELRKLSFQPGHREIFWRQNCVAVGMAAGFIEPLEASALVMIELAASMLSEELPATHGVMDIVAQRFNAKFKYRWDRIIDFLKLHYVLSQREDSPYWLDHRRSESIPASLAELLTLWRHSYPGPQDFRYADEVFAAASYQYILCGMGFPHEGRATSRQAEEAQAVEKMFIENTRQAQRLVQQLPDNRELLNHIAAHGLPAS